MTVATHVWETHFIETLGGLFSALSTPIFCKQLIVPWDSVPSGKMTH